MKFTKEEIKLCKQIAEKYKKEIKCGDWILKNDKLVLNLDGKLAWSEDGKQDIIITITSKLKVIPLWTISDCLEFLREKGYVSSIIEIDGKKKATVARFYHGETIIPAQIGKTPLEACLKAVLAVLEESK